MHYVNISLPFHENLSFVIIDVTPCVLADAYQRFGIKLLPPYSG